MPIDLTRTFRAAVAQLQRERDTLDRQIVAIRNALGDDFLARKPAGRGRTASRPRRRRMSATARRAVSQRMKAYWAKRRRSKQSAKAEPPQRRPGRRAAKTSRPATQATERTTATRQKRNQKKAA